MSLTAVSGATPAGFNLAQITLTSADVPRRWVVLVAIDWQADLRLYLPPVMR